jgi:predicted transcriptional regulator
LTLVLSKIQPTENSPYFSEVLKKLDSACENCSTVTPFECLTRCKVYQLKNELRILRKALDTPEYLKMLFNVLKNQSRIIILQTLLNGLRSAKMLQTELRKAGHSQSQTTLTNEYLQPLAKLGLVCESQEGYGLTVFGSLLTEQLARFPDFVKSLPANSTCYEEAVLQTLLKGPQTFETVEATTSLRNVSRTLKRLRSAHMICSSIDREYIFFYKTIRDPKKETLTSTERKIYDTLSLEGISAKKLARQTGFSVRVIYRSIKHLRGKKLLFERKKPKTYTLTLQGEKVAAVLQKLQQTVKDTWLSFQQPLKTTYN